MPDFPSFIATFWQPLVFIGASLIFIAFIQFLVHVAAGFRAGIKSLHL